MPGSSPGMTDWNRGNIRMQNLHPCFLAVALATTAAHAQDRPIGFQTLSKNIACLFFIDKG